MFETLNGIALSWASCTVTTNVVGGSTIQNVDIKSVDYETTVEVGEQRGRGGGSVKARTTGQSKVTAAATFYLEGLDALKRGLMEHAPKNASGALQLGLVQFDVIIQYQYTETDAEDRRVELLGCRLLKDTHKLAEGTEVLTADVDLNPLRIVNYIDGVATELL